MCLAAGPVAVGLADVQTLADVGLLAVGAAGLAADVSLADGPTAVAPAAVATLSGTCC